MIKVTCKKCNDILDGKKNKRHSDLQRSVLATNVEFHASHDYEYY